MRINLTGLLRKDISSKEKDTESEDECSVSQGESNLSQGEDSESQGYDTDVSYRSRTSEHRATAKVKLALPSTPRRKARVIEKVLTPKTSTVLQRRGLLKSTTEKAETEIGRTVIKSVRNEIDTVKIKECSIKEKARASRILKSLVLTAPMSSKSKLKGTMKKYFGFTKGMVFLILNWEAIHGGVRKSGRKEMTVSQNIQRTLSRTFSNPQK